MMASIRKFSVARVLREAICPSIFSGCPTTIVGMLLCRSKHKEEDDPQPAKADPLFALKPTPSMRATRKYFYIGAIFGALAAPRCSATSLCSAAEWPASKSNILPYI